MRIQSGGAETQVLVIGDMPDLNHLIAVENNDNCVLFYGRR
jgi:hypothetical protein